MKTDPFSTSPVAAEVRMDAESEAAIIQRLKGRLCTCNWGIGEDASEWTARWSRGRTDGDLGALVGMTADQIYQRRRVWDRFGDTKHLYPNLSWSHFYAAVLWEDATEALQWAYETRASVAELKAWHLNKHTKTDMYRKRGTDTKNGQDDGDPFGGEGEGEDGGTETDGNESQQEQSTRPPGSGKDKPGGSSKTPKDPFATQKSKAIKTFEAGMRALGDLNEIHRSTQYKKLDAATGEIIESLQKWK